MITLTPEAMFALAGLLALLFWAVFSWQTRVSAAKSILKTASVALLATAAVGLGNMGLALALGLSALGDFALSRQGDRWFLAGMAAFGAAHLVYVIVFLPFWSLADMHWVTAGAVVVLAVVMARVLWQRAGALRGPVMVYVALILAMGLSALGLPQTMQLIFVTFGALLFILSDAALAVQMFVLRDDGAKIAAALVIWPLYWCAQMSILVGLT